MTVIDHLVIAATDLDRASAWFADKTGVEPSPGGSHTGVGTRNALVALAERTYIEVIAPDPDQPEPSAPRPFGIDDLGDEPRLVTFAVSPDDIVAAVAGLRDEVGLDLGEVRSMSRQRPDGVELAWRLTGTPWPEGGGVYPFLIDWGDTPHPAATAASGCEIASVALRSPEAANLQKALDVLGLEVVVEQADVAGIALSLSTPNGVVEIS